MEIGKILEKLARQDELGQKEACEVAAAFMQGSLSEAQMAGVLMGLKSKGETVGEIAAFAKAMREAGVKISPRRKRMVDTCGTGGDGKGTFNISTAAALVAAGAGVAIAKHGNRSVSSLCGSADVLEALGVKIDVEPANTERMIEEIGIGFLFAPSFYPCMRNVAKTRKELGIRTIFNLLGPLTNPAGADAQLVGVYAPSLVVPIANVLKELKVKRALVVNGCGMDEIGLGKTDVCEVKGKRISSYVLDAQELGFERRGIPIIGSREESAALIVEVLGGNEGAARDIVVLNAAAAIYAGGKAGSIVDGIKAAQRAIDSGAAMEKLEQLRNFAGEN